MGLSFNLVSGFSQVCDSMPRLRRRTETKNQKIVVVVTILSLSGTRLESPTKPGLTEWTACNRPLGIWACVWVVRALLACGLTYWGFLRERKAYFHSYSICLIF